MNLLSTRDKARLSLETAGFSGKTLALMHSGIALGISLILTVFNMLLSRSIDSTAGLSGIGMRSALQSVQSFLSTASNMALPFWQIGFVFAALGFAQGGQVAPRDLLEGFRRFGKVLRTLLLQGLMYMVIGFACMNIASILFFFTPFASKLTALMEPMLNDPAALEQLFSDVSAMDSLMQAMIPMYVIFAVAFLLVSTPLFFRLRMAQFAIMDNAPGALAAIAGSFRMMKGNCMSLFKVDLKFWWFYALKALAAVVAYGDVLLSAAGVSLPVNEDISFFVFYGLYIVLELFVSWRFAAEVQTTYAHCYGELKANISRPATIDSL